MKQARAAITASQPLGCGADKDTDKDKDNVLAILGFCLGCLLVIPLSSRRDLIQVPDCVLLTKWQSAPVQFRSYSRPTMPTYAILGATGATGQCLLNLLLQSSNNKVHAYVRSRSKLEKLSPKLAAHEDVQIFEGALTNIPLIADCLSNTTAVFVVLGTNVSYPGMRIVQDGAHSLVAALCHIRAHDLGATLPKILFLTSAGVNPHLNRQTPAFMLRVLHTALSYSYDDLEHAEAFLRLHKSWLNVTFIQPGGLAEDVQKGHRLSTESTHGFISYPDLAAGMIEVAETPGGLYDWKGVAVVPTAKDVKFNWDAPRNMARGLLAHYLPWAYWAFHSMGLVK